MPKTKAIGIYADRKEAVRRVINVLKSVISAGRR